MTALFSYWRKRGTKAKGPTEQQVLRAGDDFVRKEQLVDKLTFLPPEMRRAAKDTALNRFLEILLSHLRM